MGKYDAVELVVLVAFVLGYALGFYAGYKYAKTLDENKG